MGGAVRHGAPGRGGARRVRRTGCRRCRGDVAARPPRGLGSGVPRRSGARRPCRHRRLRRRRRRSDGRRAGRHRRRDQAQAVAGRTRRAPRHEPGSPCERWFTRGQFATRVADGHVEAVLPVPEVEVPAHVLRVPVHLEASLRRAVPVEDGWRLTVFAGLRRVDLGAHPPTLTARMLHESGEEVSLPVVQRPDPEATRFFGMAHQNHDAGAVELELVTTRLPRAGRWHLEVELEVAGIRRSGAITDRDEHGSAGVLGPAPGGRARASFDTALGLVVVVGAPAATRSSASGEPLVEEVRRDTDLVLMGRGGAAAVRFELCLGRAAGARGDRARTGRHVHRPLSAVRDPVGFPGPVASAGHLARRLEPRAGARRAGTRPPAGRPHPAGAGPGPDRGAPRPGPAGAARSGPRRASATADGRRAGALGAAAATSGVRRDGPAARPHDGAVPVLCGHRRDGQPARDPRRAAAPGDPDLRALWVVADHSVLAPDGAEPVLFRSREFYDALGTAGTRGHQRRDGPVLPHPAGPAPRADLPRVSLQGHGARSVALEEPRADPAPAAAGEHVPRTGRWR